MDKINSYHIAHIRQSDREIQALSIHLGEVANISKHLAAKIDAAETGELVGLLHDFGKYSMAFQNYIRSATGMLDPDHDDGYIDAKAAKGKIDHSSAGAQWIWQALKKYGAAGQGKCCGQILALCVASHHSGLIDSLKPDGENGFLIRADKADEQTHLEECIRNGREILARAEALADKALVSKIVKRLQTLAAISPSKTIHTFNIGFWTRFLFSCLIDADRISSADFENPDNSTYRSREQTPWSVVIDRLEEHLQELSGRTSEATPIDAIRRRISDACRRRAAGSQGVYTLTVPTGGGKTLASLRFALHHARTHGLERIIYVIPYTSIIEQNAAAIRTIVEREGDRFPWVLEHHSNLEPETQTWHSKLAAENWDAPIVLTTMVQFLETLFGGGTRGVRRLHQLANSVIVFDEIQTLPIRCTHLFCNAINFLSTQTQTTALLCTATQPLLDKLQAPDKGQLSIPPQNELMDDPAALFKQLERVNICDLTRWPNGWSEQEIADLATDEFENQGNCLVIVNTKAWVQRLYQRCLETVDSDSLFHLSTSLCPAHRKDLFCTIRQRLDDGRPVLCISTQLIEAGVDIDFASVIRFLAGLDSIAQAAGRCNRNGRRSEATVRVVNPAEESIDLLPDIKIGRDKAQRLLSEIGDQDLLSIEAMTLYFSYYFYERTSEMDYPLKARQAARHDSLLNLLSTNDNNIGVTEPWQLRQSFKTAADNFKAIDAPTQAVIVPYNEEAEQLINNLCGLSTQFDAAAYRDFLRQAQKFSVNVFPQVWRTLVDQQAVHEIHPGEGVYYLDERHYSPDFGLSTDIVAKADSLIW
ncbi:CRISPR-associated helicase Cas3' [Methylomarinum sp. Ch1-1]|uniref:CRISPR-associated helicase Cas3 n=1 Tax=Methylomarinum roseum TaxID=3067653 RepID=A0AAU7NWZ3_9GAMM|nr:CRISPR-associated helicase Cas3' [Methylomarinum sp. Ch1-1]MDP4522444.1 CRISPR-associated helicase Cas3' [Methylomarinum sp. Ch1-1]